MTPMRSLLVATTLSLSTAGMLAAQGGANQNSTAPNRAAQGTVSPATDSGEQIRPASAAPGTDPGPEMRVDAKPQQQHSASTDSTPPPNTWGMDVNRLTDFGSDANPAPAPHMLRDIPPGNPAMIYYRLLVRTPDEMSPRDRALLGQQSSALQAASSHHHEGLDKDPGSSAWTYQQVICPVAEPGASTRDGLATGTEGAMLLQYSRPREKGVSAFTAVLPRDVSGPESVRVIPVPRGGDAKLRKTYKMNDGRRAVEEAIPPQTLYQHLQPREDWLATAACITAVHGANPHIPDRADLDEPLTTAPSPTLELMLDGERQLTLTDREDPEHYSVWTENVSNKGELKRVTRTRYEVSAPAITNPPDPPVVAIMNIPEPKAMPVSQPPSPLSGKQQ